MPRHLDTLRLPGIDEDVTHDRICGDWFVYQLARGHRFSTDDMVCAWVAIRHLPDPPRHLDLGTGLGSVGTLVLWHRLGRPDVDRGRSRVVPSHPTPLLVGVEAQDVSVALHRSSIAHNQLGDVVELRHCDLRSPEALPASEHGTYALVTGSPPYIPLGKGHVSPHPQRAACRMELRGDVYDYCRVAKQALAPNGVVCVVHAATDPRPEDALQQAGLVIRERTDIYFRRNRAPTIAVWVAGHDGPASAVAAPDVVIREASGEMTDQYLALRQTMGAPEWKPRT